MIPGHTLRDAGRVGLMALLILLCSLLLCGRTAGQQLPRPALGAVALSLDGGPPAR